MSTRKCRLDIYAHGHSEVLVARKPYTVVMVKYGVYRAIGVAKCNPKDKWNMAAGIARAKNRAVREIAERVAADAVMVQIIGACNV